MGSQWKGKDLVRTWWAIFFRRQWVYGMSFQRKYQMKSTITILKGPWDRYVDMKGVGGGMGQHRTGSCLDNLAEGSVSILCNVVWRQKCCKHLGNWHPWIETQLMLQAILRNGDKKLQRLESWWKINSAGRTRCQTASVEGSIHFSLKKGLDAKCPPISILRCSLTCWVPPACFSLNCAPQLGQIWQIIPKHQLFSLQILP